MSNQTIHHVTYLGNLYTLNTNNLIALLLIHGRAGLTIVKWGAL